MCASHSASCSGVSFAAVTAPYPATPSVPVAPPLPLRRGGGERRRCDGVWSCGSLGGEEGSDGCSEFDVCSHQRAYQKAGIVIRTNGINKLDGAGDHDLLGVTHLAFVSSHASSCW